jgi:hypothetical protein
MNGGQFPGGRHESQPVAVGFDRGPSAGYYLVLCSRDPRQAQKPRRVGAPVYDLGLSIVGSAGHQHHRNHWTRSAMDSSPRYIGQRRFNGHDGRRHRDVVDSWSQEHGSLSGDHPCARRIACVVTSRRLSHFAIWFQLAKLRVTSLTSLAWSKLQQEVEQVGDRHLQEKEQPLCQRRLAEEA